MNMFLDLLCQLSVSVFLLWGIGGVFLLLLKPRHYQRDLLLIAPFFGFAVISGLSHYLGVLGLAIRQFVWLFVVLAMAAPAVWFFRGRPRLYARLHWRILIIGLATYVLVLIPLAKLGYLTTIGTTIDGLSYAVRSEYLQQAALVSPEVPPGQPFYGWVASQINVLRVGDVYFVGALGLLTGQRSYQLLTTVAALFYALLPVSVYVFSRRILHFKAASAVLGAGLVAIHNMLLWVVYDNFFSQTLAMALFPIVISFGLTAAHTLRGRETIGFVFLLSALFSVYPVYAVLAALMFGFYAMIRLAQKVSVAPSDWRATLIRYARWGAVTVIVLWLANGVAVYRSFTELNFVGQLLDPEKSVHVGGGNISVFPALSEIFGLIIHANVAFSLDAWQLPAWVHYGLLGGCGVLVGFGWWQLRPKLRLPATLAVLAPLALALQQRFGVNPPHGYPYGYFKAISLVALLSLPFWAQGLVYFLRRPYLKYGVWGLLGGFFLLNCFNTVWTMNYVLRHRVVVDRDAIQLQEGVAVVPLDEWILLDLSPGIRQHWIGYLLKGRLIHYRERLFTQHVHDPAAPSMYRYAVIDRSLDAQRAQQVIDEPWYNPQMYQALWGNARHELRRRTDTVLAYVEMTGTASSWRAGETLDIVYDTAQQFLGAYVGATPVLKGDLIGPPLTIQGLVFAPTKGSVLCLVDACEGLQPGVWLFDIDVEDGGGTFSLRNSGTVPLTLHSLKALAVETGDAQALFEVLHRTEGAAFVTQSVEDTTLIYDVSLIPPKSNFSTYRLGLHLFDPAQSRYFGVWGLDFRPSEDVQHGTLLLDVATRMAQGTVDGVEVPVDLGPFDIEVGNIEVQVVWWKLDTPSYLSLAKSARFVRDAANQVSFVMLTDIPPTILIAP